MKKNPCCLGYAPREAMWGNETVEDGYYSMNQNISRALMARDHLGYDPMGARWEQNQNDFGYFAINDGIRRALKGLTGAA
ncbi:MAG: hypothetical protein PVJ53_07715 [Desulfobacterales bacterium]|jgi:hypothetical protein